jgi:hypothetical protein
MDNKMRTAWIALAMMVVCGAWAESKPPVPTPSKEAHPPQQRQADTEQYGTENAPFVVNIDDSQHSQGNASDADNKSRNKSTFVWGMTAEEVTALFTGLLVVIGAGTAMVLGFQSWLLRRQIILARDEFNATHRPRIILREAYTAPDNGHPITVFYTLANTGGTKATIVRSKFAIFSSIKGGTKRQIQFDGELIGGEIDNVIPANHVIEAGAFYESACATQKAMWSTNWHTVITSDGGEMVVRSLGPNASELFFYGKVLYRDAGGIVRGMAFYRILDRDSHRFIPIGDPQLEYSDERP